MAADHDSPAATDTNTVLAKAQTAFAAATTSEHLRAVQETIDSDIRGADDATADRLYLLQQEIAETLAGGQSALRAHVHAQRLIAEAAPRTGKIWEGTETESIELLSEEGRKESIIHVLYLRHAREHGIPIDLVSYEPPATGSASMRKGGGLQISHTSAEAILGHDSGEGVIALEAPFADGIVMDFVTAAGASELKKVQTSKKTTIDNTPPPASINAVTVRAAAQLLADHLRQCDPEKVRALCARLSKPLETLRNPKASWSAHGKAKRQAISALDALLHQAHQSPLPQQVMFLLLYDAAGDNGGRGPLMHQTAVTELGWLQMVATQERTVTEKAVAPKGRDRTHDPIQILADLLHDADFLDHPQGYVRPVADGTSFPLCFSCWDKASGVRRKQHVVAGDRVLEPAHNVEVLQRSDDYAARAQETMAFLHIQGSRLRNPVARAQVIADFHASMRTLIAPARSELARVVTETRAPTSQTVEFAQLCALEQAFDAIDTQDPPGSPAAVATLLRTMHNVVSQDRLAATCGLLRDCLEQSLLDYNEARDWYELEPSQWNQRVSLQRAQGGSFARAGLYADLVRMEMVASPMPEEAIAAQQITALMSALPKTAAREEYTASTPAIGELIAGDQRLERTTLLAELAHQSVVHHAHLNRQVNAAANATIELVNEVRGNDGPASTTTLLVAHGPAGTLLRAVYPPSNLRPFSSCLVPCPDGSRLMLVDEDFATDILRTPHINHHLSEALNMPSSDAVVETPADRAQRWTNDFLRNAATVCMLDEYGEPLNADTNDEKVHRERLFQDLFLQEIARARGTGRKATAYARNFVSTDDPVGLLLREIHEIDPTTLTAPDVSDNSYAAHARTTVLELVGKIHADMRQATTSQSADCVYDVINDAFFTARESRRLALPKLPKPQSVAKPAAAGSEQTI